MRKEMNKNMFRRCSILLMALLISLTGSFVLPGQAAEDTYYKGQTLDATADVAFCDGSNPNNVESVGVEFHKMGAAVDTPTNEAIGSKESILIAAVPVGEKAAFTIEFSKPIDANKLEYITFGMFAGMNAKLRVYDSETKNFTEDTAKDVLHFTTWDVEEKTLVLKKYADADGMVRNITFYFASVDTNRSLTIDYYKFTEYQEVVADYTLKAVENTYYSQADLGDNQVATYILGDQNLLNEWGWNGAVYVDGSADGSLKTGRYFKFLFDQVNVKNYETVVIDVMVPNEIELTLYAYSADEMTYSEETVDQVFKVKGGEATTITLQTAKFADEYGYMSEVNFLLAGHNGEEQDAGFQVFMGDVTFRLPREYANVTVYIEKLGGGYEKSNISRTIEGMAGEEVNVQPYDANEIGLYGFSYNASAKNVLSGVLKDGQTVELSMYYRRNTYTVTVDNNGEIVTEKAKYGSSVDLMKYRKENMLMDILVDGLALEGTEIIVSSDCAVTITQTPGNYVWFMVDGELFATRTYTPEEKSFEVPIVPIKEGYVGVWEEYELDGTDITVNAVYTPTSVPADATPLDDDVLINVANKMKDMAGNSIIGLIALIASIVILAGVLIALVVISIRKGKLSKRGFIIGGSAVAVCCVAVCVALLLSNLFSAEKNGDESTYTFDKLYTSAKESGVAPNETLTFEIDKELKDKNYIQIDVDTDVNLLGTIEYYNLEDKNQTNVEEFFIEGATDEVFYQFLDNFRENGSGLFEKHLTKITLTNVSEDSGTVTLNSVGISDRVIDMTQAELYIENEYLKAGMDLVCGGALTYLEKLPQDGAALEEIIDADGNVKLGINYGEREGAELLSESVNLINIYDKGREVQQSFYADIDEANGYTRGNYVSQNNQDWPYNPVQGGDQDDNSSQIIDFRVEDNLLYVKTRAMDWGQHNVTTKSYMENWYSLNDDMLVVKNRFIDWNGFEGEPRGAINSEMPAVYFAHAFNTYVTYDGTAPWTDGTLDKQSELGFWAEAAYVTENPSENWFAWVNEDDYGIGMYVPGVKLYASGRVDASIESSYSLNSNAYDSSMLKDYRPDRTSDYTQCYVNNTNYTAPVISTTMDWYVPLEYSYVIRVDSLDNIRNGFKSMDLDGTIDNSGLSVWDD